MTSGSDTYVISYSYGQIIHHDPGGGRYIALVTSNYHVYRALRYCRKMGLKCTGIGSRVAFYYWPSALIREYIAIRMELKHLALFLIGWALCVSICFVK